MPVCLKCGYELVFGPAGCACTQAARRERKMEEAEAIGEKFAKILGADPQVLIKAERERLEDQQSEIRRQQDIIVAHFRALQRKCKHPKIREYSAMGELGRICDDCGYQD